MPLRLLSKNPKTPLCYSVPKNFLVNFNGSFLVHVLYSKCGDATDC